MKRLFLVIISIVLSLVLSSCVFVDLIYFAQEKEYYSNKENFQPFSGELVGYKSNHEKCYIMLHIKGWNDNYPNYTESFKLEGDNYDVIDNCIKLGKLNIGDVITFVSAPRIFGDGYCPPLVELIVNSECLLAFEEGYANFMEAYS